MAIAQEYCETNKASNKNPTRQFHHIVSSHDVARTNMLMHVGAGRCVAEQVKTRRVNRPKYSHNSQKKPKSDIKLQKG